MVDWAHNFTGCPPSPSPRPPCSTDLSVSRWAFTSERCRVCELSAGMWFVVVNWTLGVWGSSSLEKKMSILTRHLKVFQNLPFTSMKSFLQDVSSWESQTRGAFLWKYWGAVRVYRMEWWSKKSLADLSLLNVCYYSQPLTIENTDGTIIKVLQARRHNEHIIWCAFNTPCRLWSRSWGVGDDGKNGLYFVADGVVKHGNIFKDNSVSQ